MQTTVLVVTLGLVALILAAVALVLRSGGSGGAEFPGEGARGLLFALLLVAGAGLAFATLRPWPHAVPSEAEPIKVRAHAIQWSFAIEPRRVPVGVPVVFEVTAEDVNHGFAVYDPAGRLLFQTQAMPGWVNRVAWRFDEPGLYRVRCLEYCGLAHHAMADEIEVEARTAAAATLAGG